MTDNSEVHSIPVAAAAAATAVPSSPPSFDDTNAGFSITESMISFLRMEAHLADNKAKRLRKQAAEIAKQFGITEKSQQTYGAYVVGSLFVGDGVWNAHSMAVVILPNV
jgi:hypothetical protein